MAGAERVEGTMFGIGERTGNLDIVTMALNMHTQGINCELDLSNIPELIKIYEKTTGMVIPKRQPYAGKLAFTAFSGSHQDAISKGFEYMKKSGSGLWEVPYLPIDPADVGRQYEPIVRVNSQSGKGGAAFIMNNVFGYAMPKQMHPEFGFIIQKLCESKGRELSQQEIFAAFKEEYLTERGPIRIGKVRFDEETGEQSGENITHFNGEVYKGDEKFILTSSGNGPINAFCHALNQIGLSDYDFISYDEHAIGIGSDAKAVSYIMIKTPKGNTVFGVGEESNINYSAIKALVCAVNRAL
jgi:2-isopropylmalate synthase